jgi:hypothetical protein
MTCPESGRAALAVAEGDWLFDEPAAVGAELEEGDNGDTF